MNPITLDLFKQYKSIHSIKYNPSGTKAVFCVKSADTINDGYTNAIYLYDGKDVKPLTTIGKEGAAIWEDDETILFPTVRSAYDLKQASSGADYTAFYRLSLNGGEAIEAFHLPLFVSQIEKVEDGLYVVEANIDANYPDFYKMSEEQQQKIVADKKANADFNVLTDAPFYLNGIVPFTSKKRNRMFIYNSKDNSLTPATPTLFQTSNFVVIGKKLFSLGKEYDIRFDHYYDIYQYDIETATESYLYKNTEYGAYVPFITKQNGQLIFMTATTEKYGMNVHNNFYSVDQTTGEMTKLCDSDHAYYSFVAKDNNIYTFNIERYGNSIYCFDGTKNESLFDSTLTFYFGDVANNKALIPAVDNTKLDELYELDLETKQLTQITHFNTEVLADKYVGTSELMTIDSHDWDVDGYVIKPIDFDPEKKYPAVLWIHGGPKGCYYGNYNHFMQIFASAGYFVMYCNPLGSDGRGNDFAEIRRLHGTVDYEDIMNFVDASLEKYPQIDPEKLGVTGISYGGFMTNWIIGHTNRFKAAASQCGIATWVSLYSTSDISMDYVPDQMMGTIPENADVFWDHSPLKYAANCTTPTLFIQPINDYRCPLSEGLMMATVLMDHKCETRVVTFAGDHHGVSSVSKPTHRERNYKEVLDWMDQHIKK